MKAVKFLKKHAPFNAGEVAGFPDAEADVLCEKGEAEPLQPELTPRKVESPPSPSPESKQAEPDVDKQTRPRRKRGRPRKDEGMTTK